MNHIGFKRLWEYVSVGKPKWAKKASPGIHHRHATYTSGAEAGTRRQPSIAPPKRQLPPSRPLPYIIDYTYYRTAPNVLRIRKFARSPNNIRNCCAAPKVCEAHAGLPCAAPILLRGSLGSLFIMHAWLVRACICARPWPVNQQGTTLNMLPHINKAKTCPEWPASTHSRPSWG
jgi:hypothetical protein